MKRPFWLAFLATFAITAAVVTAGAIVVGRTVVPPPLERFATSAFTFSLPHGWTCRREGTEFVCRIGSPPSDAIVILTMKYRNAQDTLTFYEDHLHDPLPRVDGQGVAQLNSLTRRHIGGIEWVEGRVEGSEVSGWETIYLAGNTAEIGMLITFSVHPRARETRLPDLETMATTLVVNQKAF
ncbi:hypothetical protein C3941_02095 [Kaistia algarum]|uniref:hypothetical protein n=1 Tax=Kaistia algarum TaxID=2083279 RepID=UPI000CE8D0FA|nr:hypothetical protein [Kaistia algarum]MCX5512990.1 hypothetical protein [Kaistia algarum]PPE81523.1 hypothetical protein C3941_02095 [Kaistia algarum]